MYNQKQEELINKINEIIKDNNFDYRNIKDLVGNELRVRNLDSAKIILASQILMQNAKAEELIKDNDIKLLFLFADALANAVSEQNEDKKLPYNLEDYFTKGEMEDYKNYIESKSEDSIYPIILRNVNQINEHHWECTISAQELARLNDAKVIIYNPNTQRNPRATKKGDKINTNPKKVLAIKDELLSGEYEPDHIKLNCLDEGDVPKYDQKTRTLVIGEGCVINVVDGQHRKEANSLAVAHAKDNNEEFDITWGLTIYSVSEVKAHAIMVQINKQTPMSEEWLETKDYTKAGNRVLSVMKDERSNLFDIMKETDKHILNNQALVKKSNISEAIEEQYSDLLYDDKGEQDKDGIRVVGRWLAEFFDYMIKLYSFEFKEEPYKVKEFSFINWKNTFYGYVALSRVLMGKDNWKDLFKEKMKSLDLKNTNDVWQNLGMLNTKDANATLRKKLYTLFKEGIE